MEQGGRAEAIREHLARMLASKPFRGSRRGRQFLRFVVDQTLAGREDMLKERVIGAEVFGRPAEYDPASDSIVRVNAVDVRKRLAQYYESAGDEPLSIHLSAGSYVPEFRWNAEAVPRPQSKAPGRRVIALTAAVVFAVAAVWFVALRFPARGDALDRFWAPVLAGDKPALIGLGHSSAWQPKTRTWLGASARASERLEPMVRLDEHYVSAADALVAARLAEMLARKGKPLTVRIGKAMSFTDLRRGSSVLIGAFNNLWTIEMTREFRFSFQGENALEGERLGVYDRERKSMPWSLIHTWPNPNTGFDYAIITRVFEERTGAVLISAAGILQYGTDAAGAFLTDPGWFAPIDSAAGAGWERDNMQIVLQTSVVHSSAATPKIVALHRWPRK